MTFGVKRRRMVVTAQEKGGKRESRRKGARLKRARLKNNQDDPRREERGSMGCCAEAESALLAKDRVRLKSYSEKQGNKERRMIHMKNGWKHLTALLLATVMLLCPLAGMTEENEIINFEAPWLEKCMDIMSVDNVADSHLIGAGLLLVSWADSKTASYEGKPLEGIDIDDLFLGDKYVLWKKPNAISFCFHDVRSQELVMIVSAEAGVASYGMVPNIEVPDANFEQLINKGTIDGYYRVTDEEFQTVDDILEDDNTK